MPLLPVRANARHGTLVVLTALVVGLAALASSCTYETPEITIPIPELAQSTSIYDRNGDLIVTLVAPENRTIAREIDDIPELVRNAVIAIEDERFYLHKGVDLRALIRAARTNFESGGISQGGSTITQQYVKIAILQDTEQTAARKVEEFWTARRLEEKYSKDFILLQYLNTVYFGNGAYGVQAAAQEYFSKPLADLTVAEAAMIAGLIQAPTRFNPFEHYADAVTRTQLVLDRMVANEFITEEEYQQALIDRPVLKQYTAREDVQYDAGHFIDEVKNWFLNNEEFGATYQERFNLLFQGGLRIETTIDLELQRRAEAAVETIIPAGPRAPDAAVVTTNPQTGEVLAMVGGRNFWGDSEFAKVNLASGRGRQAGSSMKPIALAAWLQDGNPVTVTYPAPGSIEIPLPGTSVPWRVKGGAGGGRITLVEATRRSVNTVYAQLMRDIGPERFVQEAHDLGITTDIKPVYAAVLGTEDVTMLDMATVYGTFANRGQRIRPTLVDRILRTDGTVFYQYEPDSDQVLDTAVADQIAWVLSGVVNTTGKDARLTGGRVIGGKTGTAQNFADATFVGFTPQRVTAVWVGFPQGQIPMTPPLTPIRVFGGTYPARIFRLVMDAAHYGLPVVDLPTPPPSVPTTTIPGPPTPQEVPSLIGMTVDQATLALDEIGLRISASAVPSAEAAPGVIINQSPRAGESTLTGNIVVVEYATAVVTPTSATVPNVIGLSMNDAIRAVRSAGFGASVEVAGPSGGGTGPPNTVYAQVPAAGATARTGDIITIQVYP